MKRWIPAFLLAAVVAAMWLLFRPVGPANCSGSWVCPENNQVYIFQHGLITAGEMPMTGAYCPAKDKVLLFCSGICEPEQELYLVEQKGTQLLCGSRDGKGKIYFRREQ